LDFDETFCTSSVAHVSTLSRTECAATCATCVNHEPKADTPFAFVRLSTGPLLPDVHDTRPRGTLEDCLFHHLLVARHTCPGRVTIGQRKCNTWMDRVSRFHCWCWGS
jgi:hypothetical protein